MAEHNNPSPDYADINIKVKTPKRLVHYGDGVVEEFSEDETDTCQSEPEPEPSIDPVRNSNTLIKQFSLKEEFCFLKKKPVFLAKEEICIKTVQWTSAAVS